MLLPALTQTVLLDRGMAHLVHAYLEAEQRALLRRNVAQRRLSTTEALSLAPLAKLLRDLDRLHQRDLVPRKAPARTPKKPRPAKPHKLRVAYPEMATIRLYYARLLASAGCHSANYHLLATALGRFHQPSLQLESHIDLADPRQLLAF